MTQRVLVTYDTEVIVISKGGKNLNLLGNELYGTIKLRKVTNEM